jgi:Ca2+-binding EF-hand superfamily protein
VRSNLEFVMSCIKIETCLSEDKVEKAFRLLDRDGSGSISTKELRTVLGENIPLQQYEEFIREFDLNGDGEFSRTEFVSMLKKISFHGY